LREQFQAFAAQFRGADTHTGEVAAGPCQAGDEPARHRIGHDRHDNRDGVGRLLRGTNGRAMGHQHIHLALDEGRREGRETLSASVRIPPLDGEVLALHPAMLSQPLLERLGGGLRLRRVGAGKEQHSDPRDLR
jgi:hypothetical protein